MTCKQLLTASAIALLVAAPLGLGTPAFAKGGGHAGHSHAAAGHASAGGHHGSGGGGSRGGRSSGGGRSGGSGLDTARSIMNLVGGFLPH